MAGFKAVFINELEKLYKRKKVVVIIALSLFAIVLGQLAVFALRKGLGLGIVGSSEFPLLVLSLFCQTILPLFVALVTIDLFSGEFAHNTMKITLTRPATRFKVFLAKIAVVAFFILVNLMVVMVLASIAGFLFNPFSLSLAGLWRILLSYLVTIVPLLVFVLFIIVLTNILRSGTAVFFLTFLFYLASMVLGVIYAQYSNLFITPLLDWYVIWVGDHLPVWQAVRQFFILLGYGIMFFTAGYYLFGQKDL
jgi:ABC-2 type transport system permease protein